MAYVFLLAFGTVFSIYIIRLHGHSPQNNYTAFFTFYFHFHFSIGTSFATAAPFGMSGDGNPDNVGIPSMFLFNQEGERLLQLMDDVMDKQNSNIVAIMHGEEYDKKKERVREIKKKNGNVNNSNFSKFFFNVLDFIKNLLKVIHICNPGKWLMSV